MTLKRTQGHHISTVTGNYASLVVHGVSVGNSVSLLETWLSDLNRTAFDVGGGDDCFFRAVSHQLYGNANNHTHVRSLGIQYLLQNPEHYLWRVTLRTLGKVI